MLLTELEFTVFVLKYQNHFEFPKNGKESPRLKILEIPGGGGSSKTPLERKILGGGGCKSKSLPWWRYGYFLEPHIDERSIIYLQNHHHIIKTKFMTPEHFKPHMHTN